MQKRFGTLMAVALLAAPVAGVRAQTTFGLIGGLNRATFSGGGASDVSWRTAFMFGGMADFSFSETFSFRPELYYSAKGSRAPTELGEVSRSFEVSYIQLPMLAQLRTASGSALRPQLFSGVSFGLLLGCKIADQGCGESLPVDPNFFDVGMLVGFEIEVLGIGMGVRYEAGLTSVRVLGLGSEIHNGVLSLTARHLFKR